MEVDAPIFPQCLAFLASGRTTGLAAFVVHPTGYPSVIVFEFANGDMNSLSNKQQHRTTQQHTAALYVHVIRANKFL